VSEDRDRKYGSDPEALAWARSKVEIALRRVEDMGNHLAEKGKPEKAEGYRGAAWRVRSLLVGGEGCSVGSFDERMADFYAMQCIHGFPLDTAHICGSDR
jgi:hypothetical protein